ncbi:MAG: L,D-transpeptidase family protein [candidate division KSB1 bacterium]|nr:L,D-transpeptidase family protein [candidate division KSB1 bacterium]MDZ7275098.1 L,D-transpeptidase family protein [candidate division KSB1 bacterium]MDZ7286454.1 L,D-transpeptidase family protein [candidate division KSB1 bacterium]MDZ7299382.1 L,D-transpeptidase family protein [candidate division KSB1 bacterium]MDZ7306289.1 L,D-transpeptidase family protein [candidate division KSB1 bacterium]
MKRIRLPQGRERVIAGAAVLAVLLTSLIVCIQLYEPAPSQVFEEAWQAVSEARRQEAAQYAPEVFRQAETYLEQARSTWRAENRKWFWSRNFNTTAQLAESAKLCGRIAGRLAVARRDSLELFTTFGIARLQQTVEEFRAQARRIPVNKTLWQKFVASELMVLESQFAHWRRDYLTAKAKLEEAEPLVNGAWSTTKASLENYLRQVPVWRRWADETIAWSAASDSVAIVVDKMAHKCYLYKGGKLLAEYPVELGPRWLGHKRQRGDNATPEGRYRIIKKKTNRETIYYKALQINYPNSEDQQKFLEARQRGELPRHATIGGLIEIHGHGGKGANWTAGCVALENAYMDELYELTHIGTPVTIVGSLKGLPANGNALH